MGITGGLVKSVFSGSCSLGAQASTARGNAMERKRWTSVRSYLCGSEFDSVLAEQDSDSVKSSEATISQPVSETVSGKEESRFDDATNMPQQRHLEEDAAIVIQSAFQRFLVRRKSGEVFESKECEEETPFGIETPSRKSVATSIEVQAANSIQGFQVQEDSMSIINRVQQKTKVQQALKTKTKEEWDDSTVSSNVSRMRIRNRMEAMTRRERALAYAFSQKLRVCSKREQTRSADTDQTMSWTWLERWMATRAPECSLAENSTSKQVDPIKRNDRFINTRIRKVEDLVGEEKESCGSNDASVHFDHISQTATEGSGFSFRLSKNKFKPPRSVSRKKTVPRHQLSTKQVGKKDGPIERRDNKHMNKKIMLKKKSKQERHQFSSEIIGSNHF